MASSKIGFGKVYILRAIPSDKDWRYAKNAGTNPVTDAAPKITPRINHSSNEGDVIGINKPRRISIIGCRVAIHI